MDSSLRGGVARTWRFPPNLYRTGHRNIIFSLALTIFTQPNLQQRKPPFCLRYVTRNYRNLHIDQAVCATPYVSYNYLQGVTVLGDSLRI